MLAFLFLHHCRRGTIDAFDPQGEFGQLRLQPTSNDRPHEQPLVAHAIREHFDERQLFRIEVTAGEQFQHQAHFAHRSTNFGFGIRRGARRQIPSQHECDLGLDPRGVTGLRRRRANIAWPAVLNRRREDRRDHRPLGIRHRTLVSAHFLPVHPHHPVLDLQRVVERRRTAGFWKTGAETAGIAQLGQILRGGFDCIHCSPLSPAAARPEGGVYSVINCGPGTALCSSSTSAARRSRTAR